MAAALEPGIPRLTRNALPSEVPEGCDARALALDGTVVLQPSAA